MVAIIAAVDDENVAQSTLLDPMPESRVNNTHTDILLVRATAG